MDYNPNLEDKSDIIATVRNWGICIIFTLITGKSILSIFKQITTASSFDPLTIGHLALLIITLFLVFQWIFATYKELKLCFFWLDPNDYIPPSGSKEGLLIILISIFLGLLFLVSENPLLFGAVLTIYSLIATYTTHYVTQELNTAINGSLKRLDDVPDKKSNNEYRKGLTVLKTYFIKRPQTKRYIIMDIIGLFGLGIGIAWKVTNNKYFGFLTYLIFFLIIFVSEIIISWWRNDRDKKLRPIESKLHEIKRSIEIDR